MARYIVDGTEYGWSTCLDASGFDVPPPDPREAIIDALRIQKCSVPEYGDVPQWCEINQQRCASSDSTDCELHARLCAGSLIEAFEVLDGMEKERARHALDAGIQNRALSDGGVGQSAMDGGARPTTAYGRAHGGGCRFGAPSPASHVWLWLLGLMLTRRHVRFRSASRANIASIPPAFRAG